MKVAIDSSQSSGSIAIYTGGKLEYSAYFNIRITHSETLMPALDNALSVCDYNKKDINELYTCIGPGSFTGLRIGLATVKGIAFGLEIPVYTFNSLQLTALPCIYTEKNILSVVDAKMKEVYAALYTPTLNERVAPCVVSPQDISMWDLGDCIVCGSGSGLVSPCLNSVENNLTYSSSYHNICRAEGLFALADVLTPEKYTSETLAEL